MHTCTRHLCMSLVQEHLLVHCNLLYRYSYSTVIITVSYPYVLTNVLILLEHSDILLLQCTCVQAEQAQRAQNNYNNIFFKEPNKNPQRAHWGPRAPLWTTLYFKNRLLRYDYKICAVNLYCVQAWASGHQGTGGGTCPPPVFWRF